MTSHDHATKTSTNSQLVSLSSHPRKRSPGPDLPDVLSLLPHVSRLHLPWERHRDDGRPFGRPRIILRGGRFACLTWLLRLVTKGATATSWQHWAPPGRNTQSRGIVGQTRHRGSREIREYCRRKSPLVSTDGRGNWIEKIEHNPSYAQHFIPSPYATTLHENLWTIPIG